MKILLYLLLPVLIVAASAFAMWVRNRQPSSVESGIDAFRREMTALSPEAAPGQRRPVERLDTPLPSIDSAVRTVEPNDPGEGAQRPGPESVDGSGRTPQRARPERRPAQERQQRPVAPPPRRSPRPPGGER